MNNVGQDGNSDSEKKSPGRVGREKDGWLRDLPVDRSEVVMTLDLLGYRG